MVIDWLISSDMIRSFLDRRDGSIFFRLAFCRVKLGVPKDGEVVLTHVFFSNKKIDGLDSPNIWKPRLSEISLIILVHLMILCGPQDSKKTHIHHPRLLTAGVVKHLLFFGNVSLKGEQPTHQLCLMDRPFANWLW